MSEQLQIIFDRVVETKKKIKDIRSSYKATLNGLEEYTELLAKINTLRARKKQIENSVKESYAGELTKLDDLRIDLESDTVMLSDIALSNLMKGQTVEVLDQYNNKYEPVFKVSFKKG